VVFGVGTIAAIALLSLAFGPPELGKPPDPSLVAADPRPDWYLLWYFAVLALLPHGMENYFMVFGPVLAGAVLLLLPFLSNRGERSPRRRPWAVGSVVLIVTMIGSLWVAGVHSDWSPNFNARPLPPNVVGATSGPVFEGAKLFHSKGCLNCHLIDQYGGRRGPNLSAVAARLVPDQMILRIANGGGNMPAYASNLTPSQMNDLVAFLQTRLPRKPRY
jgi:ubiquinol-cytochrome c reductase cytochrome b subunit